MMSRLQKLHPNAKAWMLRVLLGGGLLVSLLWIVACPGPQAFNQSGTRLLLTPFRGQSFGTSLQVPVLVAAEVSGKVSGRMCLLVQVDHATTDQIILQPNTGFIFSVEDPDLVESVFQRYERCKNESRPCLIGTLDSKRKELVVQVELLNPTAGGLVVGGLYQGDCSDEDIFNPNNIIAREALAVGQEFRKVTQEEPASTEAPLSDAGTVEASVEK